MLDYERRKEPNGGKSPFGSFVLDGHLYDCKPSLSNASVTYAGLFARKE